MQRFSQHLYCQECNYIKSLDNIYRIKLYLKKKKNRLIQVDQVISGFFIIRFSGFRSIQVRSKFKKSGFRSNQVRVTWLRFQVDLTWFRALGITNDPTCRGCGFEPETARHFVCTCPALNKQRIKYLGDFYVTPEEQLQLNISNVLSFIIGSKRLSEPERG